MTTNDTIKDTSVYYTVVYTYFGVTRNQPCTSLMTAQQYIKDLKRQGVKDIKLINGIVW